MILVTGGAGFIGSNFVNNWLAECDETVINLDKLTYAGNLENLSKYANNPQHIFVKGDINDAALLHELLHHYEPRAILHFAAESHVDRSITGPSAFIQTNILGTFTLLEATRHYWNDLPDNLQQTFRFIHISTDEVFGSLNLGDAPFSEHHAYQPNSPYSASKASSDHLVRAYFHTYHLPTLITNCSNNYGPYQFPEKLIPLMVLNAISEKQLPVYGNGQNIRDWLFVYDHCKALCEVLKHGTPGETYNIGGNNEYSNLQVVQTICHILDNLKPRIQGSYSDLIKFVTDRPGHDFRYAIDASKIHSELNWQPSVSFETGLKQTVEWYLQNAAWVSQIKNRS